MERSDRSVIDYTTMPLPDGATLATFTNVTDSVNVERALLDKNDALEQAGELKNAFIQHVSYELRSPLTNIIGFAQLLTDPKIGPLNDKQHEYTGFILSSSSALLTIVNDILDLATVDAGIMELELLEVDISETAAAAVQGLKDRITENDITFTADIPADVGTIIADEKRVRQVLFNLMSNAIAHSNKGGTVYLEANRDGNQVEISVRDEGDGIPADQLDMVFDRFVSRVSGSGRRGAGLGLSIVKSFVELHGGTVEIKSTVDHGTTIICRLPMEPDLPAFAAAE
jgi:signal transduction histidine kinase